MSEIKLKDLRIKEEYALGGLSASVERVDDKVIKPLTVTENGEYVGGEENGKQVAYSPVTVQIERLIKKYIDENKSASGLLRGCQSKDMTLFIEYNDTKNAEDMQNLYLNCGYAEKFPLLNTSKNKMMYYMHTNNYAMKELPHYDTQNVVDMQSMCSGCVVLKKVPPLDCRKVYSFSYTFYVCYELEEIWIRNIKANLQVGSGNSWGHLLTQESLIHLIKELRDTGTLLTLTMGSVNLAKIEDLYVRPIEVTDEMRAQDDLIDEKLPFELCESTDEGACLITEYVKYKNWEVK